MNIEPKKRDEKKDQKWRKKLDWQHLQKKQKQQQITGKWAHCANSPKYYAINHQDKVLQLKTKMEIDKWKGENTKKMEWTLERSVEQRWTEWTYEEVDGEQIEEVDTTEPSIAEIKNAIKELMVITKSEKL